MPAQIRKIAANILLNIEKNGAYVNIEMNKLRLNKSIDEKDIRLVGEIVNGVIKRKITLDYVISMHSSTKLKKIAPYILNVLRIGAYQLLFMDKIPPSAAVDECVKLIKKSSVWKLSGYVNAVLRAISHKDLENLPSDKYELLSIKHSFPVWLVKRWTDKFGFGFADELMDCLNKKSPLYIRCNKIVNSVEDFSSKLSDAGLDYSQVQFENIKYYNCSFRIDNIKDINRIPGASDGAFYIQDPAASLAAYILEPQKGERVLDLCAAPGGKTLFIADLMQNEGEVVSCDIYEHKLRLIEENLAKHGVNCVTPVLNDATEYRSEWENSFDRVLCDVPCSGFGIIRKKPDIKYARTEQDIKTLSELGLRILSCGAKYLKDGGTLVFSTCTIESEENEETVKKFLEQNPSFSLYPFGDEGYYKDAQYTVYPNKTDTDGFFICRLKKRNRKT